MVGKIVKKDAIEKKQRERGIHDVHPIPGDAGPIPDASGIVHRRVLDASQEAKRIIEKAEALAAKITQEAEEVLADAKVKREEAIRKGYAEGESKGLTQVTEKLMALEKLREQFYAEAEPDIVKLVLSIAEKVIGRLVEEHSESIRSIVHQALEKAIGDRITVRLNSEDYQVIMQEGNPFRDVVDRTKRLSFREDDSIAKGGCVVETEVGTIDAQLETQLAAIRKALET